jgi:hypothetical protein
MAVVFTDTAKQNLLENFFSTESLTLKLFSNNVTPSPTDVSTSYVEFSSGNYSSVQLDSSAWNITQGEATYPPIDWSFTDASGSIYGYYVVNQDDDVIFSERFPSAPYVVSNSGDTIQITLSLTLL